MLVEIDERYCIGCGRCVDDCVGANLEVEGVTARVKGLCILCGHCVAVCPTGAVSIPSYDMADVETCVPAGAAVDPRTMLRVVKSRRSVRDYLPNTIEQDTLRLVLEAGRYTATAKNAQGCRFIVVQDELDEFKRLVWDGIEGMLAPPAADKPRWVKLYKPFLVDARAGRQDFLFRNAPAVAFVAAERADDAGLAAQNMELVAASLGLGALFNGYLCRAAEELPAVKAFLEAEDKPLQICMLLGHPAVSYRRTAPAQRPRSPRTEGGRAARCSRTLTPPRVWCGSSSIATGRRGPMRSRPGRGARARRRAACGRALRTSWSRWSSAARRHGRWRPTSMRSHR